MACVPVGDRVGFGISAPAGRVGRLVFGRCAARALLCHDGRQDTWLGSLSPSWLGLAVVFQHTGCDWAVPHVVVAIKMAARSQR